MRLRDLITDARTGRLSNAKLMSSSGYLAMLVFFCWHNATTGFNAEQWLIFTGAVGLSVVHRQASKLVNKKQEAAGSPDEQSSN